MWEHLNSIVEKYADHVLSDLGCGNFCAAAGPPSLESRRSRLVHMLWLMQRLSYGFNKQDQTRQFHRRRIAGERKTRGSSSIVKVNPFPRVCGKTVD